MSEIELKPCPFCGGEAALYSYLEEAGAECPDCHAQIIRAHDEFSNGSGIGVAASAWNTRAALQPQWQDISTAPRDGVEIIARGVRHGTWGYTEDEVCWTGVRWDRGTPSQGRAAGWRETKATPNYSNGFTPSEWIPLPAAPEGK